MTKIRLLRFEARPHAWQRAYRTWQRTVPLTVAGISFLASFLYFHQTMTSSFLFDVDDAAVAILSLSSPRPRTNHYLESTTDAFGFLRPCSKAQRDAILARFYISKKENGTRTPLSKATKCPEEPWMERYFGSKKRESYLAVNVGCNKGLDAVNLARILSQQRAFSLLNWRKYLGGSTKNWYETACPRKHAAELVAETSGNFPRGHVHCLEPMPNTFARLQQAWKRAPTFFKETLVLHQAAVSNTTGVAWFPNVRAGSEVNSLSDCNRSSIGDNHSVSEHLNCTQVTLLTVDDYLQSALGPATAVAAHNIHRRFPIIDIMLIDTEGFDYEVLQGAKETLRNGVRYVSFEVGVLGNWPQNSLIDAVHVILKDFVCYWTGKSQLWRITQCTDPRFYDIYERFKSWSNVACIHRDEVDLLRITEHIFLNETIPVAALF